MCNTTTGDNPSEAAAAGEGSPAASTNNENNNNDDSPNGRARKRPKSESIFDGESILSKDLLNRKQGIHENYKASQPFPHSQILKVFQSQFLIACKEEIKSQTKVNFKESDLFRVYQSIDFANLDPERAKAMKLDTSKLTNVMKLRDLLYSQEWRSFVEQCAGLETGTLIDKIDCACNCHAPGCHLLCHDDVIGTRKISYIIYLTEEDWDGPREGGALEMYGPQNNDTNSTPVPVSRAWPIFNSMAFFEVLPGRSFHAVQEVTGERPRLSLQGWYHAKDPPPQEELEKATLQQLKSMKNDDDVGSSQQQETPSEDQDAFTEADRSYLKDYIQNEYLTEESMNEIQTKFENNSTIQFRNFLLQKWVPTIQSNYKDDDKKPAATASASSKIGDDKNESINMHYKKGVTPEWNIRGPAHKQRYLSYAAADEESESKENENAIATGKLLYTVQKKVFESEAFLRYLKRATSLDKPTGILGKDAIRQFRPGLDYTVAHYGLLMQRSVLDATMCFVRDTTEYDQAMWESGDIGGFECYIEADIDDEDEEMDENGNSAPPPKRANSGAADEYNEEDDTELLSVSASNNTLSLVYRDPGTMRFVKYVSSNAPSSRYDICMEYDLPPDDDEEKDESGDDGAADDEQ
mmetsp:Transcript_15263/g.38465  ORF Transcript_15263/g.38465 Transcript_15263/m.38465 type:complete len:637 (-) Transcript_15263:204-2114(-)